MLSCAVQTPETVTPRHHKSNSEREVEKKDKSDTHESPGAILRNKPMRRSVDSTSIWVDAVQYIKVKATVI